MKIKMGTKRIGILTGGGDCPGLNAVIHAAVYAARAIGWEVVGIREGYDGLLDPQNYPDGGLVQLTPEMVQNIAHLGGTILGTTNRGNPFKHVVTQPDGTARGWWCRVTTNRSSLPNGRWPCSSKPGSRTCRAPLSRTATPPSRFWITCGPG